jgi:hypothetical protein
MGDRDGGAVTALKLKGPQMNRKIMAAGGVSALILLSAGIAIAQPNVDRPGRNADISRADLVSRLDARFARLDANGDGNLSAADREQAIEARFKRIDADGNGAITLAEMKAAEGKRGEAFAARDGGQVGGRHRGGRGHGRHGFGPGKMGGMADANRDGTVSKAEFQARALAGFDQADADHNGVLTAAERQQARGAMRGRPTD